MHIISAACIRVSRRPGSDGTTVQKRHEIFFLANQVEGCRARQGKSVGCWGGLNADWRRRRVLTRRARDQYPLGGTLSSQIGVID